MKRFFSFSFFFLCLFAIFPYHICAQETDREDSIHLNVKVVDAFTREAIREAEVSLMEADSVTMLLKTMLFQKENHRNKALGECYGEYVPYRKVYVVKVVKEGYETLYNRIEVPHRRLGRKVKEWYSKPLLLHRDYGGNIHTLGTAVVTASRVAMVVKGDTIEYDARAFQLAEGSMLDNLLSMMPGMHVTASGQIYVNGQYVDKLLVNGRDFFNGNPRVALDNLPAYTVDKVKVYHQALKWQHLIDENNPSNDRNPFVVDVRLRREYNESWLANFEIAGGSGLHNGWDGRYLGRVFAMLHTDHSSIGIYGTINNLGDKQSPGRKGEWKKIDITSGESRILSAGAHFSVDWKKTGTALTSSIEVRHEDVLTLMRQTSMIHTAGLQLNGFSESSSDNGQTDITWNGEISFKTNSTYFEFKPSLAYSHARRSSTSSFTQNRLFTNEGDNEIWTTIYSRNYNDLSRSNIWNPALLIDTSIKSPWSRKNYGITFQIDYMQTKRNRSHWEYVNHPLLQNNTRYYWDEDVPRHNYRYKLTLSRDLFSIKTKKLNITSDIRYFFSQSYTRDTRTRLNLDEIDQTTDVQLPSSTTDENWSIDLANTYLRGEFERIHILRPLVTARYQKLTLRLRFDLQHQMRRMQDFRNETTQSLRRNDFIWWMPNITLSIGKVFTANYTGFTAPAPMHLMMAVRDATNWEHIFLGNPNLRNASQHIATLTYRHVWRKHSRYMNASIRGELVHNAIGQQTEYNEETGVFTTTPRNVDGNRSCNFTIGYGQALDKAGLLQMSTSVWGGIHRSEDFSRNVLNAQDNALREMHSIVYNYNTGAEASFNYRTRSGIHAGVKGRIDHTRQTARPIVYYCNAFTDYSYGLTFTMPLTPRIGLETDIMAYSRCGYADQTMNSTDFVWNASLSYTPDKKKLWLIRAVGFDILHELKSVRRTVNAQGYTETWYNTVPSYFTVHILYRINIQPKRR